ncbi:MAG TPA: Rieske 2Fe-2S domain-containing protein [Planctomycetota bacterium]|nr:Rieske 2Fe-2S domain-containing protein [Planctomycetota bacterium]
MADTLRLVILGPVEKVPMGQGFCFIVGSEEIAVFRQRDGKIFATQNRCPHKQGPLSEGLSGGGVVICPFHSHKFDLCSGQGPDNEQLKVYSVKEKDGQLLLSLEPQP